MERPKFENKPNFGSLFAAKTKTAVMSPDYHGEILVDLSTVEVNDGKVLVKLSGWKKKGNSGISWLSLSVNTFKPDPNYKSEKAATTTTKEDDEFF